MLSKSSYPLYNNLLAPRVKSASMDSPHTVPKKRVIETTKYYGCTRHLSTWFNQFSIVLLKPSILCDFSSDHIFITSRFHAVTLRLPGHSRSTWPSLLHCHFVGSFSFFQCGVCLSSRTSHFHEGKSFWDVHIVILFYSSGNGRLAYGVNPPHTIPLHSILDDWAKA